MKQTRQTMNIVTLILALAFAPLASCQPEAERNEQVREWCNSATTEELQKVKGIGEVLADRIIKARPFGYGETPQKVSGIGPVVEKRIIKHVEGRAK